METARSFATLFAQIECRQRFYSAQTEIDFRHEMIKAANQLSVENTQGGANDFADNRPSLAGRWYIGRGIVNDIYHRLPYYISDYTDGNCFF